VVESTNFTDQTSIGGGNGNGPRHSDALKLRSAVHDAARSDDGAREHGAAVRMPRRQLYAEDTLSGERAEDRAIEADRKNGIVRTRRPVQGNINALPTAPAEER
jgi:hypothetical protein